MGILVRNGLIKLRYWEQENLDIGVHLFVEIKIGKHHKNYKFIYLPRAVYKNEKERWGRLQF